jgi:uncharacterized protein YbjT (DUF2867 family)
MKTLAILGATGRTGQLLIAQAQAKGLKVRALARDPSRLKIEGVEVVKGDIQDEQAMRTLFTGCDAVVCALGAPTIAAGGVQSVAMPAILAAMGSAGVRRYVSLSSAAAELPTDKLPLPVRMGFAVAKLALSRYFADKKAETSALLASNLDWTMIRVAGQLVDGTEGELEFSLDSPPIIPPPSKRGPVAAAILTATLEGKWIRQAPFAWGKRG